jgi:hypothetical protein
VGTPVAAVQRCAAAVQPEQPDAMGRSTALHSYRRTPRRELQPDRIAGKQLDQSPGRMLPEQMLALWFAPEPVSTSRRTDRSNAHLRDYQRHIEDRRA